MVIVHKHHDHHSGAGGGGGGGNHYTGGGFIGGSHDDHHVGGFGGQTSNIGSDLQLHSPIHLGSSDSGGFGGHTSSHSFSGNSFGGSYSAGAPYQSALHSEHQIEHNSQHHGVGPQAVTVSGYVINEDGHDSHHGGPQTVTGLLIGEEPVHEHGGSGSSGFVPASGHGNSHFYHQGSSTPAFTNGHNHHENGGFDFSAVQNAFQPSHDHTHGFGPGGPGHGNTFMHNGYQYVHDGNGGSNNGHQEHNEVESVENAGGYSNGGHYGGGYQQGYGGDSNSIGLGSYSSDHGSPTSFGHGAQTGGGYTAVDTYSQGGGYQVVPATSSGNHNDIESGGIDYGIGQNTGGHGSFTQDEHISNHHGGHGGHEASQEQHGNQGYANSNSYGNNLSGGYSLTDNGHSHGHISQSNSYSGPDSYSAAPSGSYSGQVHPVSTSYAIQHSGSSGASDGYTYNAPSGGGWHD